MKSVFVIIWVVLAGSPSLADEPKHATISATCEDIRRAVALFPSQEAAIQAARAAGATEQQIERAKQCLNRD